MLIRTHLDQTTCILKTNLNHQINTVVVVEVMDILIMVVPLMEVTDNIDDHYS